MRRRSLISVLVLLALEPAPGTSLASPVHAPNALCGMLDRSCPAPLLHQANIVGPRDDRDEISKKTQELRDLGFRQEDFDQAMSCNVLSYCPNNGSDKQAWESGFDAGFSGQILTAAHGLYNEIESIDGGLRTTFYEPRHSYGGCFVRNFSHPDDRVPFVTNEDQRNEIAAGSPMNGKNGTKDWAVVQLARKLKGCDPYKLKEALPEIVVGEVLINISFPQEGMEKKASGKEPIVQLCHVKQVFRSYGNGPTPFGVDCDGGGGWLWRASAWLGA